MSNLRAVLRIKRMAEAAAATSDQPDPAEGREMANAYERLRGDARELNTRAGWGNDEAFDREVPPLKEGPVGRAPRPIERSLGRGGWEAMAAGRRARVLLGQLAGWAAGHQEAFEIEERLKAAAATKAEREGRPRAGFS